VDGMPVDELVERQRLVVLEHLARVDQALTVLRWESGGARERGVHSTPVAVARCSMATLPMPATRRCASARPCLA
jgi:hypothetical protein